MPRRPGWITRIPPDVRRFLDGCISEPEELEILLLLHRNPERSWDAAAVGDALRMAERTAAGHLEMLGRSNLLDVRIGHQVRYRFSPASDTLRASVQRLAETYREQRGAIAAYLAAPRLRLLKDFSDAFRLKDSDDG